MPGSILGNAVRRVEDPGFLRGASTYVDDMVLENVAHLVFVRSPYAHARITSIDTEAAKAMPGVVAVYTHAEVSRSSMPVFGVLNPKVDRPVLASDRVRFVGEAVAVVVAESVTAGVDAAELVTVEYEPLEVVTDLEAAMGPDAPLQFEALGSNLAAGFREPGRTDALDGADVVVRGRFENQRVAVMPMEPSVVAALPGAAGDEFAITLYVTTQMPHLVRDRVAESFGIDSSKVRIVAPAVGGGFGGKLGLGIETSVATDVALRLGRPVKWVETRSENLVNMHGRSQVQFIEMGFTNDGHITGMHCRVAGDCGAYAGFGGALALGPSRNMAQGVYRIPHLEFEGAAVMTNTSPTGAFRGAGRPEISAMLERIMDIASDELSIDPAQLRRMNFIRPEQFPFRTEMGTVYDTGDYELCLDEALRISEYASLRKDQAERRARGDRHQLGIGLASYVEVTGVGESEFGAVSVDEDGSATIRVGTSAHGQGHATTFSMIVAERLGIPMEKITFVQSDTAVVPRGGGTGGSRSLQMGGAAVSGAADVVLENARKLAGELLEADPVDVVLDDDGQFHVAGVPARSFSWSEVAQAADERGMHLSAEIDFAPGGQTFPFGTHVSIVDVDMETGYVELVRHVAVDDAGRVINPLIVGGQQHGGIATGIAQALWEEVTYDEDGNPLTGNLATYCIPSAADLISYDVFSTETKTPRNPLGAKGIGESPTVGSTPAVQNAVIDALSHLGVRHVDMPCTPERVWRTIVDAKAGKLEDSWHTPPALFSTLPVVGVSDEVEGDDIGI